MSTKEVLLTRPQHQLVTSPAQFPAFVGGFGSGKTHALTHRAISKKLAYPKQNVAYYLPTFDLARTIAFPRFAELFEFYKIKATLNKTFATYEIPDRGQILFRTMDNPERIVGYEVADSLADEIDTLEQEKAADVWNKILGRNRQKKPDGSLNTVAVGTTPEGFRFVYDRWVRKHKPGDGYELIRAPTSSNLKNLPAGYIESLRATYPENLLAAYLDGEFVNLTSGAVYPEFDRLLNYTPVMLAANEPIHIGMDFNVGNMAAVICAVRNQRPHAVGEIVNVLDTPAMIVNVRQRYGKQRQIFIYPDSSGKSRKTNDASVSDISLLRAAGFNVIVDTNNPAIRDRVLAVNNAICTRVNGREVRKLLVNTDACPSLTESLSQQAYGKDGNPSKTSGFDHVNDALGYMITKIWPVRATGFKRLNLVGM